MTAAGGELKQEIYVIPRDLHSPQKQEEVLPSYSPRRFVLDFALSLTTTMSSALSQCSGCKSSIAGRKQFCVCVVCQVPVHRLCCGVTFHRGISPSWKEFSSSYRCAMCSGSVVQGSTKDVADGVDAEDAVAGGSTDDVASVAVAVSDGGRPKRLLKPRSIFDPSHVGKKKPLAKASPLRPSSARQRSTPRTSPQTHSPRRPSSLPSPLSPLTMSPLVSLVVSPVLFLLSPLLRSTPPVPPPRRRRRAQLQPQEKMIVDILPDLSPATAIPRRPYESDGRREEAFAEPDESAMEQSSFEEPTEPSYKIHEEGTNKGLPKLTDGLGFCFSKKAISKSTYTWRCTSRPSGNPCKAIVKQKKNPLLDCLLNYDNVDFTFVPHDQENPHNHPPDFGNQHRVEIFRETKKACVEQKFTDPREILFAEMKKRKSLEGRDMPDVDLATRRLRHCLFLSKH
ncbi:hypothetical protein OUZ56_019588 [Daphnia magna]|uniref:Zinc finger PHD-type domain-containing protein n=1 Tax=Daphnia magna TaxID=35525 RepID=A0ABQ9ZC05_9CRUS|nr:hypothetical protein OUZ56_019588 [Daphnia magna]